MFALFDDCFRVVLAGVVLVIAKPCPFSVLLVSAVTFNDWWFGVYDFLTPSGYQEWSSMSVAFFVAGLPIVMALLMACHNWFWFCLDVCFPSYFDRFRIQKQTDRVGNKQIFYPDQTIQWSFLSRIDKHKRSVSMLVFLLLIPVVHQLLQHDMFLFETSRRLPTAFEMTWQILACSVVNGAAYYYGHRLLHENKSLYRTFHRIHHELTAPFPLGTGIIHPIEGVLVWPGFAPLCLGLLRAHVFTLGVWYAADILNLQNDHLGFKFPWYESSYHDSHHRRSNCNYGTTWWIGFRCVSLFDWLHGTSASSDEGIVCSTANAISTPKKTPTHKTTTRVYAD